MKRGGNTSTIFVYGEDNSPVQYDTKINLNAYFNVTNPLGLPIKAQEGTTIENIEFVDNEKHADYKQQPVLVLGNQKINMNIANNYQD